MRVSSSRLAYSLSIFIASVVLVVAARGASAQDRALEQPLLPLAAAPGAVYLQPAGVVPQFIIKFRGTGSYGDQVRALTERVGSGDTAGLRQRLAGARAQLDTALEAASRSRIQALAHALSVDMDWRRVLATGSAVIAFDPGAWGMTIESFIERVESFDSVESVEYDDYLRPSFVPNDSFYADQWHYSDPVAGINAEAAWDKATGAGTTVAVIDTGYLPHRDLAANIVGGYDFISNATAARDGDGRDSDATDEGDWTTSIFDCFPFPPVNSSWHGTHVAGTVAAVTNNNDGVAGVAFNSRVVPIRVLGRCGGTVSDIADGVIWASGGSVPGVPDNQFPADVINMSLGGSGACDSTYQNAINIAVSNGTVVIVAAGNRSENANNARPANCNNVVTVAALDEAGNRASFSNFGTRVDVAAPGDPVLSTLNSGTRRAEADAYAFYNGTSMAAPHVAGVAALMIESNPTLTPAEIETALQDSSRPIPGNCSQGCGAGLIDASAAIDAVAFDDGGSCSVINDFEDGDSGWTVSGDCGQEGAFVVGTPTEQTARGFVTQVGGDATTGTGSAAFTGVNSDGRAGRGDVDRGECVLTSPTWSVASGSTVTASYFHGQRDTGDDSGDYFRLEVSVDGGTSYSPIVSIDDVRTEAAWAEASTDVPAGSDVRLRLRVADGRGSGDVIEAGLDDVTICNN